MVKKKILIVSASFYPENSPRSFRTTELAKEFARQGHDVTVFFPLKETDYSSFKTENNLKIKSLGNLKWRSIKLKGGRIELLFRRAIRRGLQLLIEWPDIELMFKVAKTLKDEHGYDLLISIAVPYPIHWGVAKARGNRNRIAGCWVADCGDPYMGDKTDSFRKLFYYKYVEKWFCRRTDFITVPFDKAKYAYYPEFHDKIKTIPQGFTLDNRKFPDYKKSSDYPVFAYAGRIIPGKRDPGAILNFLSTCKKNFKFIIYTPQPEFFFPFKKILNGKIDIRENVQRGELLEALASMDFLINFDNNTPFQLPSKLIDYAITGRPVLNVTADTDFSLLLEFLDGNYSGKMRLESPSHFDIKMVSKKFICLLNS